MKLRLIDPEVMTVNTEEGMISLKTLFVPLFIEQLLMNMMGTVNTLILGRYSDDAVAAVGAANQMIGLIYTFYAVVSGGTSIVISHRLGAGNGREAGETAFASLLFGSGISIAGSFLLAACAGPLMMLMQLKGEVLHIAEAYFAIVIRFSFLQGIMLAASAILRSYGHPREAVLVSLLMNAINALLNYLIIFRPIELPLYGTTGIAWANVYSHIVALLAIFLCMLRPKMRREIRMPVKEGVKALRCLPGILKVGLPGGVSSLSYSMSQVVSTSILAVLGTAALSAKIYVSSIVFYVYVAGYSLGLSTSILIGWMAGAEEYEKAYRLNRQVLRLALAMNLSLSVLLFLFYRPLISLFTENPEITSMAGWILFIDIFVEIGRALNHVEDNSLRGAGDVVFPMVVAVISCWCVSIAFSYILGVRLGWGLYGCWIAFMLDELFRGILFWRRFRSRKWMRMRI
ncbi:MAG: MATE family efflux transporter [Blautia sp.]|nr:MATE family efflux transporter [Blautia sp.]MCM1200269.1 MATE family efflux transporter [Bacteroides fragilis]